MDINELYEILLSEKPSTGILLNEDRIFAMIPELEECKGFNQNSVWHIYDVYNHILKVVDNVPCNLPLRLAALFHDVGKPKRYTEDERGGHFYGHWEESRQIFYRFAEENRLNVNLELLVSKLILHHDINLGKMTAEGIKHLLEIYSKEELEMLFELKKADLLAQNSEYHYLLDTYENQKQKLMKKY